MRLWMLVLTAVIAVVDSAVEIPAMEKLLATEKMKMTKKEYKQVVKMHHNWYAQAVHGLLIAYAKKMYKSHSEDPHIRKAIVACLDGVTEENALKQTADCLTHLFDGTLIDSMGDKVHTERYSFVEKTNKTGTSAEAKDSETVVLPGNSTTPTTTTTTTTASTPSTTSTTTMPSFVVAKKKHYKHQRKYPIRIKFRQLRKGRKYFDQEKRRVKRALSAFLGAKTEPTKRKVRKMDKLNYILDPSGSGIKSTTNMLENILKIAKGKGSAKVPFDLMMQKIEKLRDVQIEAKTENGYRRRMLDSVLGPDHPIKLPDMSDMTITKELRNMLPNEYKSLVDMLQKIPGIDDKGRDRFLSPRFMPLFPNGDSRDNNSILSPEIMPMYRLPSLLETTGLLERERNSLLSLILESSGAMDVVDTAMDAITKTKDLGLGEDMNKVNKLIGNTFTEIKGILDPKQHAEMDDREFTLATSAQLKKLYGSQGKYNETEFPFDLDEYDTWSDDEKEQSIRNTIRILADRGDEDHPTSHGARYKRALGVPDIVFPNGYVIKFFAHTTLSPFYFAPSINTISVLGPVILSPSLFCPSFISGLLFSPPVIAPQLANPLFLSPYVLGPDVMSAAMFNVYVLSPYLMSPNIVNPYIASPLILSPFVMCPDILSPTILSGAVLSPSVLSPQVFTKNAMSISALSPSFLS